VLVYCVKIEAVIQVLMCVSLVFECGQFVFRSVWLFVADIMICCSICMYNKHAINDTNT